MLREWHKELSRLDALAPRGDIAGSEWKVLCDDAWWLYENHAGYAVRHGWDADGLFGVRLGVPYGGGLGQFLRTSRRLLWVGPIAHVTRWKVTSRLNPKCGDGLPIIWDLAAT